MGAPAPKETPAQRAERVKGAKNPFAILPDIERYAREGFAAIDKDDLDVRFRAWGIYTQGDGNGVLGGAVPYFMMRIRVPGGQLFSHQARTIADLSERYARGTLDVTDRQNVQLHWLRIEDIPTIFRELWRVGLSTQGACGDVVRNVTCCPVTGLDAEEVHDCSELVHHLDQLLNGNPAFANLPRKFKITVTGCSSWCTYPEINDIGLTAVRRRYGGQEEVGYSLRVGGGLATRPHLAQRLDAFILPHQVTDVVKAVIGIFRDSDVLRENRAKARLKFLFLDHGWEPAGFLAEVEHRLGYRLEPAAPERPPLNNLRDHVGIHPQKQAGLVYAGFSVPGGRLTPAQYRALADLADAFGSGALRNTVQQNVLIAGIPVARVGALRAQAAEAGFVLDASTFHRGVIACTGSQYCKLALTETKAFSAELIAELERRLPPSRFDLGRVKIHVTGCPNSCGHHWIADIGLQGVRVKTDEGAVDGYEFFMGGGVAGRAEVARRIPYRTTAAQTPAALERLLLAYVADRDEGEIFGDFARRHTPEELRAYVAGELIDPEAAM